MVKGGVYTLGRVINSRDIPLLSRSTVPVLAVYSQSKYGILSEKVFGGQIELMKTEVGYKPF